MIEAMAHYPPAGSGSLGTGQAGVTRLNRLAAGMRRTEACNGGANDSLHQ